MFLAIDYMTILIPTLFSLYFAICFLVLNATRLPEIFQKGKIWQIRAAYLILAIVIAYLLTEASLLIINLI